MKTSDEQIEKMAREYADENYMVGNVNLNDFEYDIATDCYKEGFKACEAKMLAEAAKDWVEYEKSHEHHEGYLYIAREAFTAGAMSQAKRVRELEEQNNWLRNNQNFLRRELDWSDETRKAYKERLIEMGFEAAVDAIDLKIKQGGER